jgi:hypothetical protein
MADLSEHNWEHRGINPPPKNGGRFEAWTRIAFSFLCGVVSAAFLFGGKSRSLDDLLTWKGETTKQIEAITTEFKRLDKDGTNRSHWVDEQQGNAIAINSSRITELERKLEQRGEQINVMQVKIEKLENAFEITKNRNPK